MIISNGYGKYLSSVYIKKIHYILREFRKLVITS